MAEKNRKFKSGSALIMTVVLTVLLAVVGIMFVLVARMDSASSGNIAENKTLDAAADSIIEIISKELVIDSPGVVSGQEYYDYPDANNQWLANIEPYKDGSIYRWRQISDITGYLRDNGFSVQNVDIEPVGLDTSTRVKEYSEFDVDSDGKLIKAGGTAAPDGVSADADGDGMADSKWIQLANIRSPKGKAVYAAVRVVDNCAMINLNTAYKFKSTSNTDEYKIDGTTQLQINLDGLLKTGDDIDKFHLSRSDSALNDRTGWDNYDRNVTWWYDKLPGTTFAPFDITDELELRYRYCIDGRVSSRIETDANINTTVDSYGDSGGLYDGSSNWGITDWRERITGIDLAEPNELDVRHLLTTYNFDRVVDPNGNKMFNINRTGFSAQQLYDQLADAVDESYMSAAEIDDTYAHLAQFAANISDGTDHDSNSEVSIVECNGKDYFGDEKPYIYISEVVRNFNTAIDPCTGSNYVDANGNDIVFRSYGIELFKEFHVQDGNDAFDPWQLQIKNPDKTITIDSNSFHDRGGEYYVAVFEDANGFATLSDLVDYSESPEDGAVNINPDVILEWSPAFLGYEVDPCDSNNVSAKIANSYDLCYGTDYDEVDDMESNPTGGEYVADTGISYDPVLATDTQYYWKVIGYGTLDGNSVDKETSVRSFKTWVTAPNDINTTIKYDSGFIFDSATEIQLVRGTDSGDIVVDKAPALPDWFTDADTADSNTMDVKSFRRSIQWRHLLRRYWDNDSNAGATYHESPTLGHYQSLGTDDYPNVSQRHCSYTNTGDVAMTVVKSTYYDDDSSYRIENTDTDENIRFDRSDISMQNVFQYITVFDPYYWHTSTYDVNEMRVRGRININTAPASVISQLPWIQKVNGKELKLADAIVAYRDKCKTLDGVIDYSDRVSKTGITSPDDIYEANGFTNIGQLMNVINTNTGNKEYDIRYCGIDNRVQYGYPDLTFNSWSGRDNTSDAGAATIDMEEAGLLFARMSDLVTVRSDVFTAYILVRVGTDGPQKRFLAILDRTDVKTKDDKVKVVALQAVPEAR